MAAGETSFIFEWENDAASTQPPSDWEEENAQIWQSQGAGTDDVSLQVVSLSKQMMAELQAAMSPRLSECQAIFGQL